MISKIEYLTTSRVLLSLILLVCATLQFYTLACSDIAWLLWGTREMLSGGVLYKDVIESNPPLIYWLYAIPVSIARIFSWSDLLTLKFSVEILALACLLACNHILAASEHWTSAKRGSLLVAIAGLLCFADSYIVFAQREHLLVVLLLPYALLHLPSVRRQSISHAFHIGVSIAASIGLCLKPHFFLIWLAIILMREKRALGYTDGIILGGAFLYAVAVGIFAPEYFQWLALFSQIFTASRYPGETNFDIAVYFSALALVAMLIAWHFRLFKNNHRDIVYMGALAAAAFVQALIQFKTWPYIAYPFIVFAGLTFFMAVILRPLTDFLAFAVVAWLFYPVTPWADTRQDNYKLEYARFMQLIEPYKEADSLHYVRLLFAPPQLYRTESPLRWTWKFYNLRFMLLGIMEISPISNQPTLQVKPGKESLERWLLTQIADNLEKKQPELFVTERIWDTNQGIDASFDSEAWMRKDSALAGLLKHYRLVTKQELCAQDGTSKRCEFKVYKKHL